MQLRPTARASEVVETGQPTRCTNGHRLGPRTMTVGFLPCICTDVLGGHRWFRCHACGAMTYLPPHDRNELPPPR